LEICIDEYNDLLEEFRNGTNCGGATFSLLKSMNEQLGEERDLCESELEEMGRYKIGFYSILLILFITAIILVISYFKNK